MIEFEIKPLPLVDQYGPAEGGMPRPREVSPLDGQVGGNHYKDRAIQPIEYIHANGLGFIEGSIVKYITRWRDKNGIEDLQKIKHYVDLLIELETRNDSSK